MILQTFFTYHSSLAVILKAGSEVKGVGWGSVRCAVNRVCGYFDLQRPEADT